MLSALFILSQSLNLAIDIGSGFYKSSFTIGSDLPQVSMNAQSKRVSPAFVAFRARAGFNASLSDPLTEDDCEFLTSEFGEKAIGVSHVRPKMAGGYFSVLIGLKDAALKSKSADLLIPHNPGRVHINDATAVSLGLYIESVTKGKTIDHITVVFPAYYTVYERLIWSQVLQILTTNISEVDDVDAIAVNYVVEKTQGLQQKPRNVLFVDVGATSIKAYTIAFSIDAKKIPSARRLSYAVDRGNGGAFLTKSLIPLLRERTTVSNTSDAEDRRLFTAAEKVKVELSMSESSTVLVEVDGIDRTITVNRSELEEGYLDSLVDAAVRVAVRASTDLEIDSVELIGGSSRLPLLQFALKKSLNVTSIGLSLDADAAIAIGGAYSTQFVLNQSRLIVPVLTVAPSLHNVTFVQGKDNVTLCREGEPCEGQLIRPGLSNHFSIVYTHSDLTADTAVLSHDYRIGQNAMGNISFWFDRHPFRFAGYDKCNDTCIPGRFVAETLPRISPEIVRLLVDPTAKTERVRRLHNDVEEYATRILDEIQKNHTVRVFTNHTQRLEIIRCADREKKWINSPEAAKVSDPRNLSAHIKELKRCIGPVYRRIDNNRTFWQEAQRLYEVIVRSKQAVEKWQKRVTNTADGSEVFRFGQKTARIESWFNETVFAESENRDFWKEIAVRPKALTDKLTELSHDMEIMKAKFGNPNAPHLMRADGTVPSGPEWDRLNNLDFVQKIRDLDVDAEVAAMDANSHEEDL